MVLEITVLKARVRDYLRENNCDLSITEDDNILLKNCNTIVEVVEGLMTEDIAREYYLGNKDYSYLFIDINGGIMFVDNKILYNNSIIQDIDKNQSIISLIYDYKEDIIKLNSERIQNYKGGIQKIINIQFDNDDKVYKIIGNTALAASADLYNTLKDKLVSIIEK